VQINLSNITPSLPCSKEEENTPYECTVGRQKERKRSIHRWITTKVEGREDEKGAYMRGSTTKTS
jgi:hypothetical protein